MVNPNYWDYREDRITETQLAIAHACYKGEITLVDYWFGQLMERVRTLNLLEDTWVIFLSDHGFYFGEHGQFGKRRFRWPDSSIFDEGFAKGMSMAQQTVHWSPLHQEVTRVPLMIRAPLTEGGRTEALVTLPDVMPTILEVLGVAIPERVQGRSLTPIVRGETDAVHPFVVTSAPFEEIGQLSKTVDDQSRTVVEISPSSITDGTWDLLYGVSGQEPLLYRTKEDPGHRHNVADAHPDVVRNLHRLYADWLAEISTPENTSVRAVS
ncbi:MAG: sulfatase-like hydrolase/transferase [Chloroflexi bacterium]|nr:sulfatase-like hydrolase/transferase [Chloroflexota bacterium]